MEISPGYSHTKIFSSVVSVIRSPRLTRWREAITRMAPSNVKQSVFNPSVKWMAYLTVVSSTQVRTDLSDLSPLGYNHRNLSHVAR